MDGDVRRIAVELLLVAAPAANLEDPSVYPPATTVVTEGDFSIGETDTVLEGTSQCEALIKRLYQAGKGMITLAGNKLRVLTCRGYQNLSFKAATTQGKRVRREWLSVAFGPTTNGNGEPIGLNQAGRTRVIGDLKRGLISRREATFLGIQFSLLVATRFKVLQLREWDDFRSFLFKEVYESSCITTLGKTYKKLTTAIGNHLLRNKLQANPRGQLEKIVSEWSVARRIIELLLRLKIDLFRTMPDREAMWYVAHLTQSRFLPGPSRAEVIAELVGLKSRLCGSRTDWVPSKLATDSISSAAYMVGDELTKTKGFKLPTQGHLSLSNSGCIEFTRREGGKLALLWTDYKGFIESPVSQLFEVTVKKDKRLDTLRALLASVETSVRSQLDLDHVSENVNPWGVKVVTCYTQDHYIYGSYELDRLVQQDMARCTGFQLPEQWSLQTITEAHSVAAIPLFRDYPELTEFVPDGTAKRDAYHIAMANLRKAIERLETELRGTYDPLGNTICKDQYRDLPIWKIAYLEEPLPEDSFREQDFIRFFDGTKVMETRAGVDSRFGRLLFLWASIEFREWKRDSKALPVEAVPISEPGVKSRVATKSLIWVNLFLSPASHFIKDIMLRIPGCRVGLKGSDHAWNFEASWGRHCDRWDALDAECISTSDLTAATDYLEHNMGITAMKSFLDGVGITGPEREYLDAAIVLNASKRLLLDKPSSFVKNGKIRNIKTFRKYSKEDGFVKDTTTYKGITYSGFVTRRGLLMGEPLTKMMLSLFSIAAERSARASTLTIHPSLRDFQLSRWTRHIYACAGDDHIGIGKFGYLSQIPKILESWSGVISWDKYCISNVGAHYCQDFLLLPRPGPRYAIRPQDVLAKAGIQPPKYKIDHIPLRFLSDRRKTGPEVFEETNPFPGKAKALTELLAWQRADLHWVYSIVLLQKLGLGRWFPAAYLKDYRTYVPQIYGGRGITTPRYLENLLSPQMQHCIASIGERATRVANSSGNSRKVRGIVLDGSNSDVRLQEVHINSLSYEEVLKVVNEESLATFGSVSYTATHKQLRDDFMTVSSLDIVSQKIEVAMKAFSGPTVLSRRQLSYESRMRAVARAQDVVFNLSTMEFHDGEKLSHLLAMRNGPHREERYVRRSDVEGYLPKGYVPSFTIPVTYFGGSMSRIEMGDRVLPQMRPPSVISAPIERDSISVSGTEQDHTSLGSFSM